MRRSLSILILGLLLQTAPVAFAQSAPMLLVPADSRGLSMGGVSLQQDAARMGVNFLYAGWAPRNVDNTLVGGDVFYRASDRVRLSFEGRALLDHPYDVTSPKGQVTGSFRPVDWTVAAGATVGFADAFAVGVKARLFSSAIAENARSTAFCGDIFFSYRGDIVSASVGVRNLGTKINYGGTDYPLPALAALQGSVRPFEGFTVAAEADYLFNGALMAGLGVEYTIAEIVSLRGGFHYGDNAKAIPTYASLGLGVQFAGFHLDAAFLLASKTLGNTLMVGLGYAF